MKSGFKIFAWILLGFLALSAGALVIKLVLAPVNAAHTAVNAANGVVSKTINSNNIITNYEWFFDVNAQFDARRGQIRGHHRLIQTEQDNKERSRLNVELAAIQQSCRDLASRYNANSEKMNRSLFKANSLPETLATTACEV